MLGVVLAMGLAFDPASPPPLPLALDWDAPAGCPSEPAIAQEIARILGRELVFDASADVAVLGEIASMPSGFALVLETRVMGVVERRTMSAPTCGALFEGASLAIAVALDPFIVDTSSIPAPPSKGALPGTDPGPESAPSVEAPPAIPRRQEDERSPSPALPKVAQDDDFGTPAHLLRRERSDPPREATRKRRPRASADLRIPLLVGPTFGQATPVTAALGAGVAWARPRLRLELNALYGVRRQVRIDEGLQLGISGATGSGRVFWTPHRGPWQGQVGAGMDVGAAWGRAIGAAVNGRLRARPTVGWVAAAACLVEVAPWLLLGVRAELIGALVRPRFYVGTGEALQDFYAPGAIGGRITWITEFRVPRRDGTKASAVR